MSTRAGILYEVEEIKLKPIIEVSVVLITYNQVEYIRRAIDSILDQNTDFPYEIVIHDDASTDGTKEILSEYEQNYPEIIRCIYEETNQYSQGKSFLLSIIKNETKGRYIAFCEGDDYWIDKSKLQVQFNALEKHLECDMCACWGCTVDERNGNEISQIRPSHKNNILSMEEVILGGGQYLVSAGLFFRKEMCNEMYGLDALDYSLQMRGALRGGIYYIDRKMAVYRRYSKGSWTNNVLRNNDRLQAQWDRERKLLNSFDENTNRKYHNTIIQRLKAYSAFEDQLENYRDQIKKDLDSIERPVYIWGLGRRGRSLENYLKREDIIIDGVCDLINVNVGQKDEYENSIVHTDFVLENAKTIIASTKWAYDDLREKKLNIRIMDFQKYMPYG